MIPRLTLLAGIVLLGSSAWLNTVSADNDDLKCTAADQSTWMSEDATKDLLLQQGYKEVREIDVTDGHCYEVYGVDAQGEKVEIYLDPTNGAVVAKDD